MDEAWELLNRDPPLVWRIQIDGETEEQNLRESLSFRVCHRSSSIDDTDVHCQHQYGVYTLFSLSCSVLILIFVIFTAMRKLGIV
jgi:hypothetical protein